MNFCFVSSDLTLGRWNRWRRLGNGSLGLPALPLADDHGSVGRVKRVSSVAILVCACGSSQSSPATTPSPTPTATSQSLADAMHLVCDATTRAENDPEFQHASDPATKASVLGKHIRDGVTNDRVLAAIDGWRNEATEARLSSLDALTKEAGIPTCPLRQIWLAGK